MNQGGAAYMGMIGRWKRSAELFTWV